MEKGSKYAVHIMIHSNLDPLPPEQITLPEDDDNDPVLSPLQVDREASKSPPPNPESQAQKIRASNLRFDDLQNHPEKLDALLLSVFEKLDKDKDGHLD